MIKSIGFAAQSAGARLALFEFDRRDPGPRDVELELLFCGVCHTDVHMVDNDSGIGVYPMVPGHEMVGRVVKTGAEVTKFHCGDHAGIGCFTGSCRRCSACGEGLEQYCERFPTGSACVSDPATGQPVFGGFANNYVIDEHFAVKMPSSLHLARAAPLLCGGITTYSALRHWNAGPGKRVGVIGLGGLGHLAVKLARAMGAHVIVLTRSQNKVADALNLGAHEAVLSTNAADLRRVAGSMDLVLETASAFTAFDPLLALLRRDGTLCMLGMPKESISIAPRGLGYLRKSIAGSIVGGLRETQEMLDFCAVHGIEAEIEIVPVTGVNEAFDRLKRNDVKYRFVLDLKPLNAAGLSMLGEVRGWERS